MSTSGSSKLYSLLQAFDLTGQRLFQNNWSGHEVFTAPTVNPAAIMDRKEAIERELLELRRQDRRLQAEIEEQELSEAERRDNSREAENIYTKRDALNAERNALPEVGATWTEDHAAFERRMKVEKHLREAFEDGALTLQLLTGYNANYAGWITQRHFYISFGLSVVIPPRSARMNRRRYPAYIDRNKFEIWLYRFRPDAVLAGELNAEEKCRFWLAEQAQRPKGKRNKQDFFLDANRQLPDLTRRAFDRAWADTVPDLWKSTKRSH